MFLSITPMFEKFHTAPYRINTESSEDFLMVLRASCSSQKNDIELSIKNSPADRAMSPLMGFAAGVTLLVLFAALVSNFIFPLNGFVLIIAAISSIAAVFIGVKHHEARIVHDEHFRKESWVSFYETHLVNLHASYFTPLSKYSPEFREMSKFILSKNELKKAKYHASLFDGTFEALIESSKSSEVS